MIGSDRAIHELDRRDDIDGVRAFAVVFVLLFHAGVPGFEFGFWGVDSFLVVSGYLITGAITRQIVEGRFALGDFWARRVRRLLPAGSVVMAATVAMAVLVGSPLLWRTLASDTAFASVYLLNLSLGFREASYFDVEMETRPLLHLWSLSLEEQFYVVWPLFLLALSKQKRGRQMSGAVVVLLVSLIVSIVCTRAMPTPSYYLLPARMWEFAVGGVLAVIPLPVLSRGQRSAMTASAIVLFGVGVAFLTPFTPIPGILTVLPVLATAMIVAAGNAGGHILSPLLVFRPVVLIGRLSYSLYLWHWPVLVLWRPVIGNSPLATTLLLVVSGGLALATYVFVEQPLRYGRMLRKSERTTFVFAGAVVVLLVSSAAGLRSAAAWNEKVPETAELLRIRGDTTFFKSCDGGSGCVLRPDGSKTVLVLGDSHAMQWTPAIVSVSAELGLRVVFSGLGACSPLPIEQGKPKARDGDFPRCRAWHEHIEPLLDSIQPQVVVVAGHEGYLDEGAILHSSPSSHEGIKILAKGAEKLAGALEKRGVATVFVLDAPEAREDGIFCASRRGGFDGCEEGLMASLKRRAEVRETMSFPFRSRGSAIVDISALVCPAGRCSMVFDGVPVYRDKHHVTRAFAMHTTAVFDTALRQATAQKGEGRGDDH